jgi:hypothetical protein
MSIATATKSVAKLLMINEDKNIKKSFNKVVFIELKRKYFL